MSIPASAHGRFTGQKQLYLEPGADAIVCDAEFDVSAEAIKYRWSYKDKPQEGSISLTGEGASYHDTWHQSTPATATSVDVGGALVAVSLRYAEEGDTAWVWRIVLSQRPSGEVVLQMFNKTPWGEDGLAVNIVGTPASD